MKIEKIINGTSDTLFLCMAGWSVPPEFMRTINLPSDADHWWVYDYRDLRFEASFANYKHIHLIAWSLGVWVATYLWAGKFRFSSATAINGTPFPVDEQYGIPPAIFEGTLANIHEEGMKRFNRRMCGDKETLGKYLGFPARPLEEVKEELTSLHQHILSEREMFTKDRIFDFWNQAVVSTEDRIFPTANLLNYWEGRCPVITIKAPHLPFYKFTLTDEIWKQPQKNL